MMLEHSYSLKFIQIFIVLALVFSLLSSINQIDTSINTWKLKIDPHQLKKQNTLHTLILNHDHHQENLTNLFLTIYHKNGSQFIQSINIINSHTIQHHFTIPIQQIKNIFLSSPINIQFKNNGRLLQTINPSPQYFDLLLKILVYFFSICRNIILLATITNTFDIWMPLLIFIQTFYCLGLWTHQAHIFSDIYTHLFNCKLDIFNFIRLVFSQGNSLSDNIFMANYNFTNMFIFNCSGQLCGLFLLVIVFASVKGIFFFTTNQKIRKINDNLRPALNGYIYWITPRIVTMAGISLSTAPFNLQFLTILHQTLAIVIGIVMVLCFFVLLVLQIKGIHTKLQYISESRYKIGLVFRIDYMKDFQMDCIVCSMLYYPAINLGRLIFAHLCIGFAPNFHYVQFGGVIAAQIFYFLVQITCSGFNTTRHKILSPILDFIYAFYMVIFIGIGMVYAVNHLQLTITLQILGFIVLVMLLFSHLLQSGLDIIHYCKIKNQNDQQEFTSSKNLDMDLKTNNSEKQDQEIEQSTINNQSIKIQQANSRQTTIPLNVNTNDANQINKIKKIKNGKLI